MLLTYRRQQVCPVERGSLPTRESSVIYAYLPTDTAAVAASVGYTFEFLIIPRSEELHSF
jgi:hypothetical protein